MDANKNIETVTKIYQAFGVGDVKAMLGFMTDEFEWYQPGPSILPFAGLHKGHDGTLKNVALIFEIVEFAAFEPQQFVAQGDKVVVLGREQYRVKATNKVVDNEWAHVWTLRDDKAVRLHEYNDTDAMAAAYR